MNEAVKRLSDDLALSVDPVKFALALGIDPDPWQRDILLSTDKRVLLTAGRQVGKSSCVSILALHHAINTPKALVLVLSPSLRQSSELFKTIVGMYRQLGRPIPAQTETALTLELKGGARIVSLPGKEQTVRGFAGVSVLLIDEAALVSDDLYMAVRPMLAVSNGRLIALSTPHGKRGWFYRAFVVGAGWKRYEISADLCPRISKEFLDEERKALGQHWFEQEYLCKWHENETSLFRAEVIQRAMRDFDELDLALDDDEHAVDYDHDGFEPDW